MSACLKLDTPENRADLARLETEIAKDLKAFVRTGMNLLEVRNRRLYKLTHDTWEDYCRERWDLSRSYSYQLMSAALLTVKMSAIADIANESQARALAAVAPERQEDILKKAKLTGPLTADGIKTLIDREFKLLPPEVQKEIIDAEERELLDAADDEREAGVHAQRSRQGDAPDRPGRGPLRDPGPARQVGGADVAGAKRAVVKLLRRAIGLLGQLPDVADEGERLIEEVIGLVEGAEG